MKGVPPTLTGSRQRQNDFMGSEGWYFAGDVKIANSVTADGGCGDGEITYCNRLLQRPGHAHPDQGVSAQSHKFLNGYGDRRTTDTRRAGTYRHPIQFTSVNQELMSFGNLDRPVPIAGKTANPALGSRHEHKGGNLA